MSPRSSDVSVTSSPRVVVRSIERKMADHMRIRSWAEIVRVQHATGALAAVTNVRSGASSDAHSILDCETLDIDAGDRVRFDLTATDERMVAAIEDFFAVVLPVHRRPHAGSLLVGARPAKVLVAEPQARTARRLVRILEGAGATVTAEPDPAAVVATLQAQPFDLAWLGFRRGKRKRRAIDGVQIARHLRGWGGPNVATPLLVETADPALARILGYEGLLDCIVAHPFSAKTIVAESACHLGENARRSWEPTIAR